MDNASKRLLNIMKKTNINTISNLLSLTVLSTNPLQLTDKDKLILDENFLVFHSMIVKSRLSVGDKLLAITLNDGQVYFIIDVISSAQEVKEYKIQ